jgi:hypothetical protein
VWTDKQLADDDPQREHISFGVVLLPLNYLENEGYECLIWGKSDDSIVDGVCEPWGKHYQNENKNMSVHFREYIFVRKRRRDLMINIIQDKERERGLLCVLVSERRKNTKRAIVGWHTSGAM